jgi:hypothetical protein
MIDDDPFITTANIDRLRALLRTEISEATRRTAYQLLGEYERAAAARLSSSGPSITWESVWWSSPLGRPR